jgi:hypothetical protein
MQRELAAIREHRITEQGAGRWRYERYTTARTIANTMREAGYQVEGPGLTNDLNGWRVSWCGKDGK